jgi:hypothetical protein
VRYFYLVCAIAFAAMPFCGKALADELKREEKVVGPPWEQGTVYTLSPKGLHLATVGAKGSRFVVTVDGVEGPKFEEILKTAARFNYPLDDDGKLLGLGVTEATHVAFSPDGNRFAYTARQGQEMILICDGKEILRAPFSKVVALPVSVVHFSPDSKHLIFVTPTADGPQTSRLMIDGKPAGPPFSGVPYVFYSDDGAHWGLSGNAADPNNPRLLVVDGNSTGYTGESPRFTPDGKHLLCTNFEAGKGLLLKDGKPLATAFRIESYTVASTGDVGCVAMDTDSKFFFYLNGEKVQGTEDARRSFVSPDCKHWAVGCSGNGSYWVVLDGKRQQNYANVRAVGFSPDSSKLVYVAQSGNKQFLVVNGEEDAGSQSIAVGPYFGKDNNHLIYGVNVGYDQFVVHIDDKALPESKRLDSFAFSPDGTRVAYYAPQGALASQLFIDGAPVGSAVSGGAGTIAFSPDSQHVAAISADAKGKGLYRDGKFSSFPSSFNQYSKLMGFTADSRHVLYQGQVQNENGTQVLDAYYVDGQEIAKFNILGLTWATKDLPKTWALEPDGSVIVVGAEPMPYGGSGPPKYGPMKRVTVSHSGAVATARQQAAPIAPVAPAPAPAPAPPPAIPVSTPIAAEKAAAAPVAASPTSRAPAPPSDLGVNPDDADIKGLKVNQAVQPFIEAAKKVWPSVKFDPASDPSTVFMSNEDKSQEAKGFVDNKGVVFALRYMRKLHGDDVDAAFDSLVSKYGKPIMDSGPQPMKNGLMMRGVRWTKPNVLTPPTAGLFASIATAPPGAPKEGMVILDLRSPGEHAPPAKPGQTPSAKPKLDF